MFLKSLKGCFLIVLDRWHLQGDAFHHARTEKKISSLVQDICLDPGVNLATIEGLSLLCSHAAKFRFFRLGMKKVIKLVACDVLSAWRGYLCNVNQSLLSH